MRRIVVLMALVLGAPGVFAASAAIDLDPVDTDHSNLPSLQRGAALFANYCLGCHGLQYQRHQRTANDLGVPEGGRRQEAVALEDPPSRSSRQRNCSSRGVDFGLP